MSELIDRQALLDSIYKNLPMIPSMAGMTAEEMRLRIAALIENAPPASPWRRVEEPPEEEKREYLVCTDTGYMCSCRWTNNIYGLGASDRWGWCLADVPQYHKVTHWMPIEPPQEDA